MFRHSLPCAARALFLPLALAVALLAALPAAAAPSDEEAANRLFVEAVSLTRKAEKTQDPTEKIKLIESALDKLDTIVAKHPSSSISVKLITGQAIGDFSRDTLEAELAQLRTDFCAHKPSRACLIAEVRTYLDQIKDPTSRDYATLSLASTLASIEDFSTALINVKSIKNKDTRNMANRSIAIAYANAGKVSEGEMIAAALNDPALRGNLFVEIADIHLQAGQNSAARKSLSKANETLQEIDTALEKFSLIDNITRSQVNAGLSEEANDSLDRLQAHEPNLQSATERALYFVYLGSTLANLSLSAESDAAVTNALAAYENIGDTKQRESVDLAFTRNLARMGRFSDAIAIATNIQAKWLRNRAYREISQAQMKAGLIGDGVLTALEIDASDRVYMSTDLITAHVEAGRFAEAIRLASELSYASDAISGLSYIARKQAQSGDIAESKATVAKAQASVGKLNKRYEGASALANLASVQYIVGNLEEADQTVKALFAIAKKMAEGRDYSLAIEVLMEVVSYMPPEPRTP